MVKRRDFLALLAGTALAAPQDAPSRPARFTRLFKSPEGAPNALETGSQGLWIGEQVSDRAFLVDWKGKVLQKVDTESSNTSGMAYGRGFLWMAANGKAVGRPSKPTDAQAGDVVKVDAKTGKTVARFTLPTGGGVHGLEYTDAGLWVTFLKASQLALVSTKDFSVIRTIPVGLPRAHGLAWDKGAIWCAFTGNRVIQKLDAKDGTVLETLTWNPDDPETHGMCMHQGHLYGCDAGIAPGGKASGSSAAGWVFRID